MFLVSHLHVRAKEFCFAVVYASELAIACLISYSIATYLLSHPLLATPADDLLGGMWATIATVFVYRTSINASVTAALSRVASTAVSFLPCQLYLVVLPFSAWGLVILIGLGSVIVTLLNRRGDIVTTCITISVVMVAAGVSPSEAWLQPMLRLFDTCPGVAVAVGFARLALRRSAS